MKSKPLVAAVLVGALLSCGAGKWQVPPGVQLRCEDDPNCRKGGGCEPACEGDECDAEYDDEGTPGEVAAEGVSLNVGGAAGAANVDEENAMDFFGAEAERDGATEP